METFSPDKAVKLSSFIIMGGGNNRIHQFIRREPGRTELVQLLLHVLTFARKRVIGRLGCHCFKYRGAQPGHRSAHTRSLFRVSSGEWGKIPSYCCAYTCLCCWREYVGTKLPLPPLLWRWKPCGEGMGDPVAMTWATLWRRHGRWHDGNTGDDTGPYMVVVVVVLVKMGFWKVLKSICSNERFVVALTFQNPSLNFCWKSRTLAMRCNTPGDGMLAMGWRHLGSW
jgi:hypothetical protein